MIGARIKQRPEDFVVRELLGFEPDGAGEHLLLEIEKSGLSTPELVQLVARDYGLAPNAIGYSGLKDKHALCTQWLSLHLPRKAESEKHPEGRGYRVLRAARHRTKLRRGSHRANEFDVRLRAVDDLPRDSREQLAAIEAGGIANYFGQQRFGSRGDNVEQALRQLGRGRLARSRRGILVSALRAYLFNQVLARRIELDCWRQPLDGDVFMLRGSRSIFSDTLDPELLRRYRELDVSSCASLYGSGRSLLGGQPLAIETGIFDAHPQITACLERQRSRLQMRALRVAVENLDADYDAARGELRLRVRLPRGSYLTTLLAHFAIVTDASQPALR